jgi:alpha-tubulin suppressor-like RCC1 family protein
MAPGGQGVTNSGAGGVASTAGVSSGNAGGLSGNSATAGSQASCDDLESAPGAPTPRGALARGYQSACVVVGGRVACWGRADDGQLGDGQAHLEPGVSDPVWVSSLDDALEVGLGYGFACARRSAGNISCWGRGETGQLGDGRFRENEELTPSPVAVRDIAGATMLSVGGGHACVVTSGASVRCWGFGRFGELGDGVKHRDPAPSGVPAPVDVLGITGAVQVAAGGVHTCALLADHSVWCWGMGGGGELGDGSFHEGFEGSGPVLEPVQAVGIDDALQISAGGHHTCALRASGRVACWGTTGIQASSATAVDVCGSEGAVQISVGDRHACAVLVTGRALCWGFGLGGALGDGNAYHGDPNGSVEPVSVLNLDGVAEISAGTDGTCALKHDGRVFCWGGGEYGELGTWDVTRSNVPLEVDGFEP